MKRFIFFGAVLGSVLMVSSVEAALTAYSYQGQFGFIFTKSTGVGADGELGTLDDPTVQLDISDLVAGSFSSGQTASTDANVTSIGSDSGGSLVDGDADPAQVGIALADNADFSHQVGAATPYARADTDDDGGSPISFNGPGGGPPTLGASLEFVADTTLTNFTTDDGTAQGSSQTTALFTISLAAGEFVWVEFAATQELIAELIVPTGTVAQATSKFTIDIVDNTTGASIFSWTPDGATGLSPGGNPNEIDSFDMDRNRSRLAANGTGTTTVTGGGGQGGAGAPFKFGTFLASGSAPGGTPRYNIDIASENSVRVSTINTVPEPTSFVVWGAMGLIGICRFVVRRRRKLA